MSPYLDSEGLDVVGAIGTAREVRQVELNLVPAIVQPHGHGANERLHSRRALVIAGPESPPHVLVIQNLGNKVNQPSNMGEILQFILVCMCVCVCACLSVFPS